MSTELDELKEGWPEELTPEEQKQVDDFAAQIDLTDTQQILQYGVGRQKKIADFSENALKKVQAKDLGEIGKLLTEVVTELKSIEGKEAGKGFFGFLKKSGSKLSTMRAKYEKAEANITGICKAMERHQIVLLKDIAILDKLYKMNVKYFKELSIYILAGRKKLAAAMKHELPQLTLKAEKSGLPEDTQEVKDFTQMCNRFERKIHDLELTRMVALQIAPQIRLIQNNDSIMSDKIQTILVNTIPLWRSQMVIAVGLEHASEVARAQREVSDMTKGILRSNADALKAATAVTAKESRRGIADLEMLKVTNQALINTIDEVVKIQEEGAQKRQTAEIELKKIESEMRSKLMEVSGQLQSAV